MERNEIDYLLSHGYSIAEVMNMETKPANTQPVAPEPEPEAPAKEEPAPEEPKEEKQEVKKNFGFDFETTFAKLDEKINTLQKSIQKANRDGVENPTPKAYTAEDAIQEIISGKKEGNKL